ncbi:MAG: ATP-binding protein [bacterium]
MARTIVLYAGTRSSLDAHYLSTTRATATAVVASFEEFSRYAVEREIRVPEITGTLAEALETGNLDRARSLLRSRLHETYEDLAQEGFRTVHFHLPDGRSLLRFHAPDTWGDALHGVRDTVRIANSEHRFVSGFEIGRFGAGHRFVYPLAHDGRHVGSVELGISVDEVIRPVLHELGKDAELVMPASADLLRRPRTASGAPRWVAAVRQAVAARHPLRDDRGASFVLPVSVDGNGYVVTFVRIVDLTGDLVAYFVQYEPSSSYRKLVRGAFERGAMLLLLVGGVAGAVAALVRARRAAESANRAKGQFLANVSHELRTPMNGVVGMIAALHEPDLPEERRGEYLRLLRGSSQDLMHMVDSILEMSRLEAGRVEVDHAPFSVREAIEEVVESLRESNVAEGLSLRWRAQAGIPDYVLGDRLRFRQVLTNCVHNALKFTHEGGVTVQAEAQPIHDGRVSISTVITDTGIGIPDSHLPHLFEKFAQGAAEITQAYGGSGLGLSIAKSLVDMMGGSIGVRSVVGVGTSVTVAIPFCVADEAAARSRTSSAPGTERAWRVLLAEDDRTSRRVVVVLLEQYGVEVVTAANGAEAVARARDGLFDAILMDRHMPELDGLEATARLHEYWETLGIRPTPIIGLSGGVSEEERRACISAGMDGFVAKPVVVEELFRVLREVDPRAVPLDLGAADESLVRTGELVREILPQFLDQVDERLVEIHRALEARAHHDIHAQTHPLKTAALYLGAQSLSETARIIDEACRRAEEPDWSQIERLVPRLEREIERIREWQRDAAGD